MRDEFIAGFALVAGMAVAWLVIFALFVAYQYARNFVIRYRQSATIRNECPIGPNYRLRRMKWAFNALRRWGADL